MAASKQRVAITVVVLLSSLSVLGATAPIIDSFTVTPAVPVPGQNVTLRVAAHDPDCSAPPCTTACGTIIRSDLLFWSDDSGRTSGAFTGSSASPNGSPWNATVTWIAPPTEGTYTVRANVADNGGMLCGGRQTKVATLQVNVSSARPPTLDSCVVTPPTLPAGAVATITAAASDPLGRPLTYAFAADAGTIAHGSPSTASATWTAPKSAGSIALRCTAIAAGVPATLQTMANVEIGTFVQVLAVPGLRATRVAALPDGRMAAVDGTNGVLAVITAAGSIVWRAGGLRTPVAVAIEGEELFVLERGASRVSVWTKSGARVREMPLAIAVPNQMVAGPGAGELAISDTGAARIVVVSAADGRILRTVGEGMLKVPAGLAVRDGRLAIADAAAGRVLLFDPSGALQATLGDSTSLVRPQGLAWDAANARVIVADSYSGELAVVGEENAIRGTLAGFGSAEGQLVNPIEVTLLAGGMLATTTAGGELSLFRLSATLNPLAPPQALAASDRPGDDGGAIALAWTKSLDDPARVTAYRIERSDESGETFAVLDAVERETTTFVDSTATDGVCVRYRVIATDGVVDAPSNTTACAVARNDLAPPQPGALVAVAESPTRATIEWSGVAAPDLRGYAIELTSTMGVPIARTLTATSVVLAELTAGTTYDVAVRAVDTAGNASPAVTAQLRTYDDAAPPAPANVLAVDAKSGGTLDVSWSAVSSSLPIATYRVVATPLIDGWPAKSVSVSATKARLTGLVNELAYRVSVTAITPWERESEPAVAAEVAPSAPVRALPFVAESDELGDAAGIALQFGMEAEKRELRLQYRALGTALQVVIDTRAVATLADTGGTWSDAVIAVEKKLLKSDAEHQLELRSSAFPVASARLSLRRVDFVPLAPRDAKVDSFNTVADIVWMWNEPRADLGVVLTRDGVPVLCVDPQLGRCRDTFLENGRQALWTLRVASPAGWLSEAAELRAHAKYAEGPPPITDLLIVERDGAFELTWTPLSSASTKDAKAIAVKGYRIYAAGALAGEVASPPAVLRNVDPRTLVVRAIDAEGRESQ